MNINAPTYKEIFELFKETHNLIVQGEDTCTEKIVHEPSGWYFYTGFDGIVCFFKRTKHRFDSIEVDCPSWTYLIQQFTKPNIKIQKAVYEYQTTK